jgi:hypothetical protein
MENNNRKFEEQDHPLKNTDKAFVQVGKNGEPVVPQQTEDKQKNDSIKDDKTTIGHR